MRSHLTNAAVGAAMVMVVVGCSDSSAGTPTAGTTTTTTQTGGGSGPSTTSTGSGSADRHGAPPVENPLDLTRYLTEPCAAISPRLLQSLGLPVRGKPDTDSAAGKAAPSCSWDADGTGVQVAFRGGGNGLADLYQRQERGFWKYWEETTVDGYPAVFADISDDRSTGFCILYVAPSDPVRFQLQEHDRQTERACGRAKQVATAVVKTMKGEG